MCCVVQECISYSILNNDGNNDLNSLLDTGVFSITFNNQTSPTLFPVVKSPFNEKLRSDIVWKWEVIHCTNLEEGASNLEVFMLKFRKKDLVEMNRDKV
jgi:hypothetical protein